MRMYQSALRQPPGKYIQWISDLTILQLAQEPPASLHPRPANRQRSPPPPNMTIFARESTMHDCPVSLPLCGPAPLGPGPAINANVATAKESMQEIPFSDPTLRDPNAALNKYDHRMAPAMILGGVFVILLVAFGLGLLVTLDKDLRRKVGRWMSCGRRQGADGMKSPASDRSDITRVNTAVHDVERGMSQRMSFNAPSVRGVPSPLRQESMKGKSEDGAPAVPVLHARS